MSGNGYRGGHNGQSSRTSQPQGGSRHDQNNQASAATNAAYAPYNFVPLSNKVWSPRWGRLVSQDVPLKGGLSGSLTVRITAETPTLVGGGASRRPVGDRGIKTVEFFQDVNGQPAIPGSTLKGLIRNVVEIASFSKFSWVDDVRLGVRDLTRGGSFYKNRLNVKVKDAWKSRVKSGFLSFQDGTWYVLPCDYGRVEHSTLKGLNPAGFRDLLSEDFQKKQAFAKKTNASLFVDRTVVESTPWRRKPPPLTYTLFNDQSISISSGDFDGKEARAILVVTGKVSNKHREFIFYRKEPDAQPQPIAIPKDVISAFLAINAGNQAERSTPWGYWHHRLTKVRDIGPGSANAAALPGIPVFYTEEAGKIAKLGLAQMFKMAYDNTTHDMIRHTSRQHLPSQSGDYEHDLAELMFGCVAGDAGQHALKGRVSFGLARLVGTDKGGDKAGTREVILNTPKPSYYPFYVEQQTKSSDAKLGDVIDPNGNGSYATFMNPIVSSAHDAVRTGESSAKLRGWKRYLPRAQASEDTGPIGPDQTKVAVRLSPVEAGTAFESRIDFHNLLPAELGALVFSLVLSNGKADGLTGHHLVGMGKPYGYGLAQFVITVASLEANELRDGRPERVEGETALLRLSEFVGDFKREISASLFGGKDDQWLASAQVLALQQCSDVTAVAELVEGHLPYMKLGKGSQNAFVRVKGGEGVPNRALPSLPLKPR